jgi:hypothetical protein
MMVLVYLPASCILGCRNKDMVKGSWGSFPEGVTRDLKVLLGVGCRVSGVGCREKLTLRLREGVKLYSGSHQKLYCLFILTLKSFQLTALARLESDRSLPYLLFWVFVFLTEKPHTPYPTPHTPHPIPCLPFDASLSPLQGASLKIMTQPARSHHSQSVRLHDP